jgi:hypothetical protein
MELKRNAVDGMDLLPSYGLRGFLVITRATL